MLTLSEEQLDIIKSVSDGFNVIVDSVAGSGKTTLIKYIAKNLPNKSIQVLTYNRRLMDESNARFIELDNVATNTFHSFACRNYCSCRNDDGLLKAINSSPKSSFKPIDILIIDESQDLTPLYFKLLLKILGDLKTKFGTRPQLCFIGDKYQSIYQFNSADSRFLTDADKLLLPDREWKRHNMHTSYRITDIMAKYLNQCVLGYDRIKAQKSGAKIEQYLLGSAFAIEPIYNKIKKLLKTYKCDDIFVLSASIKGKSETPIKKLANLLSLDGFPVGFTSDKGSDKLAHNKIVFSSFHQSKGLERKVVIVMGYDENYYKYFARSDDPKKCNNPIYVALTRAKERLILISNRENLFSFVKRNDDLCHYYGTYPEYSFEDLCRTASTYISRRYDYIDSDALLIELLHENEDHEKRYTHKRIKEMVEELFEVVDKYLEDTGRITPLAFSQYVDARRLQFANCICSKQIQTFIDIVNNMSYEEYIRMPDNYITYIQKTDTEIIESIHNGVKDHPIELLFITDPNRNFSQELREYIITSLKCLFKPPIRFHTVSDIIQRLNEKTIDVVQKYIKYTTTTNPQTEIKLPNIVENTFDGVEAVADINGIALPLWHEYNKFGYKLDIDAIITTLKNYLFRPKKKDETDENYSKKREIYFTKINITAFINAIIQSQTEKNYTFDIETCLKISTIYHTAINGLSYRLNQIKHYNWLKDINLDEILRRFNNLSLIKPQFEVGVNKEIHGIIDCYDAATKTVWEFKACGELESKHILQLALYAYLVDADHYKLFNVLNNHLIEIFISKSKRVKMMAYITFLLNDSPEKLPTQSFVELNKETNNKKYIYYKATGKKGLHREIHYSFSATIEVQTCRLKIIKDRKKFIMACSQATIIMGEESIESLFPEVDFTKFHQPKNKCLNNEF